MDEDQSWNLWAQSTMKEISQLRVDYNRLNDKIDANTETLNRVTHELEIDRITADHAAKMEIQELQLQAKSAGSEAGAKAGKEATAKDRLYYIISGIIAIGLGVIAILRGQ